MFLSVNKLHLNKVFKVQVLYYVYQHFRTEISIKSKKILCLLFNSKNISN